MQKDQSIIKEALHWVEQNTGHMCSERCGDYNSPRISSELPDCSLPLTTRQNFVPTLLSAPFCVALGWAGRSVLFF